ncbi:DUF2199 domain-containing protein [Flavobacterium sp. ASV13]|uniref:DUF2199 domain-containing protein n=1 Tax=Flavobacterium sp. ASV13 TaxID=1506583 RepID=UPI0009DD8F8A|nr:DUF2199 domain-containing protein [Flavobacterium sp. ASV13]
MYTYKCSCCGEIFNQMPLCFGNEFPAYYFTIPPKEREKRIEYGGSWCYIDEEFFFHQGRLTIPIIDYHEDLVFNVWTTISEDNFCLRMDLWEDPNRVNQEPYFGWMQTNVPTYGETLSLKSIAIEQGLDLIPEIRMIEENHPLTIDQENGITLEKAISIVDEIMKIQHGKT